MNINNKELQQRLNKSLSNILTEEQYNIGSIRAIDLLTPQRIDLVAKYLYVKFKVLDIKSDFAKNIYLDHIRVFNGFVEANQKTGKDEFLSSFDTLIDSYQKNGLKKNTIIPFVGENIIHDGAHRVSVAIYFDENIPCVDLNVKPYNFNFKFFEERGLKEKDLDALAMEYLNIKKNYLHMILLWPSSGGGKENELAQVLDSYGQVVYRKKVFLKNEGPVNLIKQAYKTETWLGTHSNGFAGARDKAKWCFDKKGAVRVILFESKNNMIEMKEKIRNIYHIDKHAIHITDTEEEAKELAGLLFNQNSIHWMNNSVIRKFFWFNRLFLHYQNWLPTLAIPSTDFCIDGSSTLALYGIREARDLDFIHFGKKVIDSGFKEIGDHNSELQFHLVSKDEMIFNPQYHLIINGYKFVSIQCIDEMKRKRREPKDLEDINMINELVSRGYIKIPIIDQLEKLLHPSFLKAKVKFIFLIVRYFYTKFRSK